MQDNYNKIDIKENKSAERMAKRKLHKDKLMYFATKRLLDDSINDFGSFSSNKRIGPMAYLVKSVAAHLGMSIEDISIPNDAAAKLDQIGLLNRLTQKANMRIRLVTLTSDWYKKDSGALIGYYGKEKTMVALLPVQPGQYTMLNAENPEGIEVTSEVAGQLDANAFICYVGFPNDRISTDEFLRFILKIIYQKDIATVLLASAIIGVLAIVVPFITQTIFEDIIPSLNYSALATVTQVAVISSFVTFIVSVARSVSMLRIMAHTDMNVEAAIISRLIAMPTAFFRQYQAGDLSKRLMSLQEIKTALAGPSLMAILSAVFSISSLFLMVKYSVQMTALCVVIWLVYAGVMYIVYAKYTELKAKKVAADNKLSGMLLQVFSGLSKFRTQGAEQQAYYLWAKDFGESWKWNLKLRWRNNYSGIIMAIQPIILNLIVYYFVMSCFEKAGLDGKSTDTVITYAEFMGFQTAMIGFNTTINQVIPAVAELFSLRPLFENLKPILEGKPEVQDDKADANVLQGRIEIRHVHFSYAPDLPDVLKDINISINAGENVAIVGRSGCGKSTLVRLLLGFETPHTGAIYYDDQNMADVNPTSIRNQMGVVLQNGQLMTGDLYTNIVGTASLSMDDAWAAAETAGLADDIREMPMGMQTVISEGSSNISGGQRQRVLIARALAQKPAILIFDEATSALDNRTQAIVTESLDKLSATRIVVAHRLSTIRNCDRIIVLDKGTVAESGSFEELMAKGGLFAAMVKRQIA